MILRRFIKHVEDENWFAVGLDFFVVVAGIFIGMQVTEWNNSRISDGLETQYLEAFKVDINASKQFLDERLIRIEKQSQALEIILIAGSEGVDDMTDEEAAEYIHNGLNSAAILPVQMRTYEDLKGSNTVSLIKNIELRHKLRELDARILLIRQEESERLKTLYGHIDPMLLKYPSYIELTRYWRNFYERGDPISNLLGIYSAKEIYKDPKLVNVSILMTGINRTEVRFLTDLMPFYDSLLVAIEQELASK